ncbi:hypothetical protein LOAG_14771 [Loa loa]|uniref:Uncharacterized protein n=1 Tax=Loa loa TaxID=7209 RepID=A0A1S0TH91_LOALO|nr:hypothetical protein LOAG_14771 [Loa loa]EFO13758.1 hypothetical protein LOAG_14771 [Loa loa]
MSYRLILLYRLYGNNTLNTCFVHVTTVSFKFDKHNRSYKCMQLAVTSNRILAKPQNLHCNEVRYGGKFSREPLSKNEAHINPYQEKSAALSFCSKSSINDKVVKS